MIRKFLLKIWWCYIWRFHDWTSAIQEGVKPVLPENPTSEEFKKAFYESAKMYCKRCGHESEFNKRLFF